MDLSQIKAEADKIFKGLPLTGGPNGTITLRALLRVSDEERKTVQANIKRMQEIETDEEATNEDLRKVLVEALLSVADKKDDLVAVLAELDIAELLTLFQAWAKETQLGEA